MCSAAKTCPAGQKSLAYAFTYRATDKTLTDAEANAAHTKVVDALQAQLEATVKSSNKKTRPVRSGVKSKLLPLICGDGLTGPQYDPASASVDGSGTTSNFTLSTVSVSVMPGPPHCQELIW